MDPFPRRGSGEQHVPQKDRHEHASHTTAFRKTRTPAVQVGLPMGVWVFVRCCVLVVCICLRVFGYMLLASARILK